MIARALSFAHDLLDLTSLARAVHRLARERDALAALAGQLEGELQHATDTAEALRAELADRTAPRDAASPEAEVLRLAYRADRSWRDDVEAPALRQQLQAAEVELAAARAEVASLRDDVRKADAALYSEREGRRAAEVVIDAWRALVDATKADLQREHMAHMVARDAERAATAMADRYAETQRRLDRRGLTVARLVTALRRIRRVHAPVVLRAMLLDVLPGDAPPSSTQDHATCGVMAGRKWACVGMICTLPTGHEGAHEAESSIGMVVGRWIDDDAPPPTQPSERRPVEPAPERAVRVAAGGAS